MSVYLSAVKKAVEEKALCGPSFGDSPLIRDILKGHTRTFRPSLSSNSSIKSISAPFTLTDFRWAIAAYRKAVGERPPSFDRALLFASMAIGLGGWLRPGEYLKTNAMQRTEALLSVSQLSFEVPKWAEGNSPMKILPWKEFLPFLSDKTPSQLPRVQRIFIHLKCSKTDKTKRGSLIRIADPLCVSLLIDYLRIRPLVDPFGQCIEALLVTKSDGAYQQYTAHQMTGEMRTFLSAYGFPNSHDFTLKSLRSGAAQSATDNGASPLTIQSTGRWTNFRTPNKHYLNRPLSSKASQ